MIVTQNTTRLERGSAACACAESNPSGVRRVFWGLRGSLFACGAITTQQFQQPNAQGPSREHTSTCWLSLLEQSRSWALLHDPEQKDVIVMSLRKKSLTLFLAGTALAVFRAARGQAFVLYDTSPPFCFSGDAPAGFMFPARAPPPRSCRSCCSSASRTPRSFIGSPAPTSVPPLRPLHLGVVRGSSSGRRRFGRSSGDTARFSTGGGGEPRGPGTQQLSRQAKLAISILIDLIGMSSFALPGVGEVSIASVASLAR